MTELIAPHGGELINCTAGEADRAALAERAASLVSVELNEREHSDLELIACGALSPLTGFMTEAQFNGCLDDMRLPGGVVWTIPVTLAADNETAAKINQGDEVALSAGGETVALMRVESKFGFDVNETAQKTLATTDESHPGVAYLKQSKPVLLGGPVTLLKERAPQFPAHHRTPEQTRALFRERGWKRVVAFQTRNPIHRAHEYLTKAGLEVCDGLLVHPLVGETKEGDIPADVRMRCYETLLEKYYPADRVVLSTLPAAMRYAGPREAIHHAIMRKNYGCTHFIVGRDHAGVGSYYGTYDAQEIFDRFEASEIGIEPLRFEHTFWHTGLNEMVSLKTSPGPKEAHLFLSGTKVRAMLEAGEDLPAEFTRPEVSEILKQHYSG